MADIRTWNGLTDGDYETATNWLDENIAISGDTVKIAAGTSQFPTSNQLGAGTLDFDIDEAVTVTLDDFLDGAAINDVVVDGATEVIIESNANSLVIDSCLCHIAETITIIGAPVTVNGGTLSIANTKTLTCVLVFGGAASLDWNVGGAFVGAFDAAGNAVTHTDSGSASVRLIVTGDFDLGGEFGGDVVCDTNHVRTVTANQVIGGSLTLSDGTFDDGGYAVELGGNFDNAGGTFTSTGIWTLSGVTKTVKNAGYATPFGDLILSGTYTIVTRAYASKATITGTLNGGAASLSIVNPAANWWGSQTGTVNCDVVVLCTGVGTMQPPGNPITVVNRKLIISSAGTHSCTWDADIDLGTGDLEVQGTGAGDVLTLDLDTSKIRFSGDLIVGSAAGSAVLSMGSAGHSIGGLSSIGVADTIHLDSCYLECSGVADFGNFSAHDADADDVVRIVCPAGGEITNFDPAQKVHCHGDASVDGGGNGANVTFNEHAPPASRRLLGVGI